MVVSDATFPSWLYVKKTPRDQLLLSKDTNNRRVLQFDCTSGTPCHNQPNVVVLDATFHWCLAPSKRTTILIDSFQGLDNQRILESD